MIYGNYLRDKYNNTAVKLADAEGVPCIMEYSKGKNMRNYEIYGNSVQGKNLLPYPYFHTTRTINGITFTDNGDGSVTVNGTATANATHYFYQDTKNLIKGLKTGDTITVSLVSDKTWATSPATMSVVFNYYNSAASMQNGNCALNPTITYKTITIGDDWVGIGMYIVVLSGQTVDNITLKAQVELGSTATEWQSPVISPDNPIEIQSVGDLVTDEASEHYGKYDIPIVCRGKNLLNTYGFSAKEINSPSASRALTNSYGTTISTTEPTNSITITQVYNSDYAAGSYKNGYICIGINDEVIFGKSYRLSFDIDISENPANAKYISISSNGTSSGGSSTRIPLGGIRVSSGIFNFVQSSSVPARRYIELSCMGMSFTISNIMITEADIEDIEYEPYIPPVTTNIYLDEPLRKVGDYADYIDFKNQNVMRQIEVLDDTGTKSIDESLDAVSPPIEESVSLPTLKTFKGTSVMTVDTIIQPSNIKTKYVRL